MSPRTALLWTRWTPRWLSLPEMLPRDGVQLLCRGAVNAGLGSFPRSLQEHGEDGEQDGHDGRVPGQVGVHRPRVD